MSGPSSSTSLTEFQVEVARLFFSLPASEGFLLAGGAALAAQALTSRPTRDLDFFASPGIGDVTAARDALSAAIESLGWSCEVIRDQTTFCRLLINGPESLIVDLAVDTPPNRAPTLTFLGPTFAREELAGRKTLALFDRAEARDFADVYSLALRYGRGNLLGRAAEIDSGFDLGVFAQMLDTLGRFDDSELPVADEEKSALRRYFSEWRDELTDDEEHR